MEKTDLSFKKRKDFYDSHLGKIVEVLFESKSKDNFFTGLTKNYLRIKGSCNFDIINRIQKVKLNKVSEEYIYGQVVSDGQPQNDNISNFKPKVLSIQV